ncbi:hypothetical protein CXG81DRAFT_13843 [Caulochytrium protostelioides]|uniref:histidinol-phosphate transaminase n=1 Tax=Caulochytrium protostelioides TaxID=1555241 RepID=A0A4P9X4E8_9FUNG|nr:hypothetical protein CXG81DRAFT_13843 [Caulochytrium protostelioides]|eukprot:RKO99945.1 hypothetical protein CXG81DRAFT_13843 [Caulochytrium protostelioides]
MAAPPPLDRAAPVLWSVANSAVPEFDLQAITRPNVWALKPYHCARDDFTSGVLLDANENSYGPCAVGAVGDAVGAHPLTMATTIATTSAATAPLHRYPDPLQLEVKQRFCALRGVPDPSYVFLGTGSDEALDLLVRIVCRPAVDAILICPPTYGMYQVCAAMNDVAVARVPLEPDTFQLDVPAIRQRLQAPAMPATPPVKIVFVTSPGNPTGSLLRHDNLRALLTTPGWNGIVVVDEAYIDFSDPLLPLDDATRGAYGTTVSWVTSYPNLVVTQTLSKAFGLAGIRAGFAVASPPIIGLMNKFKAPYNVGVPTAQICLQALAPSGVALMRAHAARLVAERYRLLEVLSHSAPPGLSSRQRRQDANFVLVTVLGTAHPGPDSRRAHAVYLHMAQQGGVVVRSRVTEPACAGVLRITVGTPPENQLLVEAFKVALAACP